jgi:hypothetical protein
MHVRCAGLRARTCRHVADPSPRSQHAAFQEEAILLSTGGTGEAITSMVMQHPTLYEDVS